MQRGRAFLLEQELLAPTLSSMKKKTSSNDEIRDEEKKNEDDEEEEEEELNVEQDEVEAESETPRRKSID